MDSLPSGLIEGAQRRLAKCSTTARSAVNGKWRLSVRILTAVDVGLGGVEKESWGEV